MILMKYNVTDYDFNNTGEFKKYEKYQKCWVTGRNERKRRDISDEEFSLLEYEGFRVVNKDIILHEG